MKDSAMGIEIYYTTDSNGGDRLEKGSSWKLAVKSFPGSIETWVSVMSYLERKYLPSLPDLYPLVENTPSYHSRLATGSLFSDNLQNHYLQELWDLQLSDKITKEERLTLLSMMDRAYIRTEDASEVFEAWLKVAAEIGGKTERAFYLLVTKCQSFIDRTNDIEQIAVNWNSVNPFHEVFGYNDKQFFDCRLSCQAIENAIEDSESSGSKKGSPNI